MRQNVITITVKTTTEQPFFIVIWMFFVSHSPWFGLNKRKKTRIKAPNIKKVLVLSNCLNGFQIMQLGLEAAFITSTASFQIRTTHFILAARGTFPQQCSRGFDSPVSSLISRSREGQKLQKDQFLCSCVPRLHLNSLLVAVWLMSRTLLLIPPHVQQSQLSEVWLCFGPSMFEMFTGLYINAEKLSQIQ